jgi:ribosomal protein L44E
VYQFIEDRLLKTNYGRIHQLISVNMYNTCKEFLASIIHLTKNAKPLIFENIKKFEDLEISERMYLIKNKLDTVPVCPHCKQAPMLYVSIVNGYGRACSNKCWYKYSIKYVEDAINTQGFDLVSKGQKYLKKSIFDLRCQVCNKEHSRELTNSRWKDIYCPGCFGDQGISKEESELLDYIKLLDSDTIQSYRFDGKKEFDVYSPKIKLAAEYDGVYWHSTNTVEGLKDFKNKHLYKTNWAIENGMELFHVFSNEWTDPIKKEIWKSMISHKFKLSNRLFARECTIRTITHQESSEFLDVNHLQGRDQSSVRLGLFFENTLCAVMTFTKAKYNKNYEWELSRYCNKIHNTIVGGASKLLKFFINSAKPNSIIAYANRRYSEGDIFKVLGFTKLNITRPNYSYFKSQNLHARNKFQKHKLNAVLSDYDPNLTEFQNMFNNKYRVIFDCGNVSYGMNLSD